MKLVPELLNYLENTTEEERVQIIESNQDLFSIKEESLIINIFESLDVIISILKRESEENVDDNIIPFLFGKELEYTQESKWFKWFQRNERTKVKICFAMSIESMNKIKLLKMDDSKFNSLKSTLKGVIKKKQILELKEKPVVNAASFKKKLDTLTQFEEFKMNTEKLKPLSADKDIQNKLQLKILREDLLQVYTAERPLEELSKKLNLNSEFNDFIESCMKTIGAVDKEGMFDSEGFIDS